MLLPLLLLFAGFILLIKSAGWLVTGASALARKYMVSELVIGLTIVAFGTSAPEMVVNVFASFQGHQVMAFSNIVGSNLFNLLAILGIVGLISPVIVQASTVWKEIPISLFAVIVLLLLGNDFWITPQPMLSRIDGIIFLILFGLFLLYIFKQLKRQEKNQQTTVAVSFSSQKIFFLTTGGLAGLIIGGKLIVDNAVELAQMFNISEKVIGVTIVAAGTSLPELATSVVAALKKNKDIAVGNIIGSNIFNIFLILGLSTVIAPFPYQTQFNPDLFFLTGGSLFLFLAMFTGYRKKLDRWEAFILLLLFGVYLFFLFKA